jgi:integrase
VPRPSPVSMYLAELSPGSWRTMRFGLGVACRFFGGCDPDTFLWHRVRADQISGLRADLAERLAPNTANKILAAVKGVLRASWRLGLMSAEDMWRCTDVKPVKGGARERGRALARAELAALFRACGPDVRGRRDATILALVYGCRRSEAVGLELADYEPTTGRLCVRHAKGGKSRDVFLANGSKKAVDVWLRVRGNEPGPLLTRFDSTGRVVLKPITDQTLYQRCRCVAELAGIEPFSPHDLRRTFAGDMLDAGVDLALVQQLMGHSSVATTVGYDRRPEAARRAAAGLVGVPFSSSANRRWTTA